ncbi:hypothetical protein C8N25_13011 [Algoriphagus antarcticus]|uniref:Uncharacterized protein n=1 Tax=Algoriphagus antarcticus TaxID=238540 RepID=A0A3E0DAH4_9BACT|nr:hypothetical protein C8N25_13011 [Algoriphagus antarcticus]
MLTELTSNTGLGCYVLDLIAPFLDRRKIVNQ